jgi:hypothetical protein
MRLVQRAREKAVLPEVTATAQSAIERQSVLGVDATQQAGEGILAVRHGHEMDVVGHQAIAQEARAGTRRVVAEKIEVKAAIIRRVEDRLAIIATLGDVVGNARKDCAGTAGHKE